jgi:hypothetical protein
MLQISKIIIQPATSKHIHEKSKFMNQYVNISIVYEHVFIIKPMITLTIVLQ